MKIPEEIKKNHEHLSMAGARFLEFAERTPEAFSKRDMNFSVPGVDYLEEVQSWPTFINNVTRREYQRAAVDMLKLINRIPRLFFDNDPEKVTEYYRFSPGEAGIYLTGVDDDYLSYIIGRGDFMLNQDGMKIMEYNIATNLGGWEVQKMQEIYLNNPIIARFLREYRIRVYSPIPLMEQLVVHLIHAAQNLSGDNDRELNIVFACNAGDILPGTTAMPHDFLQPMYQGIVGRHQPGLGGKLLICQPEELEIRDERLFFQNTPVDLVLHLTQHSIPGGWMELFGKRRLIILNSAVSKILCNKLNLAILSENQDSPIFSPAEQDAIHRYVPWSRKFTETTTTYKNETVDLPTFVRDNRERMVIKPSDGGGGFGVCVGRFETQADWEASLNKALAAKNWLVQEYLEPFPLVYRCGDNGCALHENVVGLFAFGYRYIGGFFRVQARESYSGVINCYQGATISSILDVDE